MLVSYRMTKEPITVELDDLLSQAAHKMKTGGFRRLPVVSDGKLVGIVTERDLREHRGHLEHTKINGVMSDCVLEGEEHGFNEASRVVAREHGEVLGVGTYRDKLGNNPICYLRLISENADKIAKALRASGFDVLGVHRIGGAPK